MFQKLSNNQYKNMELELYIHRYIHHNLTP